MPVTYAEVRDWVLALPGGTEVHVERWGRDTLRYGQKMFVLAGDGTLIVKASREDQTELIDSAPEVYSIAPFVGRHGWVSAQLASADADELRQVVTEAWRRTAPKKVVREFDSAQG